MGKSDRPWELARPIRAWPGEHFNHEGREVYAVHRAVSLINRNPEDFEFIVLPIDSLREQVEGRGGIDLRYVATLSNEDAVRPVLLGRYHDGTVRMLDGYHRATWLLKHHVSPIGAWLLTPAQTDAIRVHLPPGFLPPGARVTPTD